MPSFEKPAQKAGSALFFFILSIPGVFGWFLGRAIAWFVTN
jgi:hypothetical protein